MIGTKLLDRYEVVGELGRGGMGIVYRARDPLLNRDVAVKLVPPALLTPQAEERFQREAQLVAQMNHPGIVSIFDIGRHEGSLFFLMPVVSGSNLRIFLREHPRSVGDVIDIAIEVADALDYSHSRGVIHRDIKPENIMVSDEGGSLRVCVMDFGLAKASSENRLTKTGTLIGTVAYFSPEQVTAKEIDHRSDIYSFGTVLYECLAGTPPFSGEVQSILYRIVHENPRSLRSLGADIAEELEGIVLKCLAKDPARRYQRASELAEALRRYGAKLAESDRARSVILSTIMTAQFQRPAASPFIGHEKELAELQRRLNAAVDGECQFVVLAGEPGIGKTRLLEELANLAKARKIRVLHGRFLEQNRAFSYQGFCELIQDYFRSRESTSSSGEHVDFSDLASDLVSLFPVLTEISAIRSAAVSESKLASLGEGRKAEDRTYIYELLAKTIARIAAGKPLVLIFENLHGAEMSLDALQYVVQRLGPTPTLIAGTYRQTEVDRGHPLVKLLDSFSDDPRYVSITLGPLSPSEHRLFIESIVGSSQLARGLPERLYNATEANPFFTRELVRSLIDSGGIARDDSGAWSLSREMAISSDALPATIQQAIEKRIERLDEDMREILCVASVLGKTFDFKDLQFLTEDAKNLEKVVDRLIGEGIIEEERESRGDRLTFSSGIVRDVLYGALSRRRRRSLHLRYAEYLEKQHGGRLDRIYAELVHHFSEGDDPEKTVEYGLKQAVKSLEAFSAEETIHVAKTVLDFVKDREWRGDRGVEGHAHLLLAEAYRMQGNVDGALREAELAYRVFDKERQQTEAMKAILLSAETAWQGRRIEESRRWLSLGIDVARTTGETAALARLLSLSATVANLRGEYEKAKEYLEEAERLSAQPKQKTPEAEVPRGGRLAVALANPAHATEPGVIDTDEDSEVLALVFETLVTIDDRGHLLPQLCEKWEVLNEGRSVLLTLRRDVRFEDGASLTAHDVKASFERAIRLRPREMTAAYASIQGLNEFRAGSEEHLRGIVVRSDAQLEIQLAESLPIYPSLLTDPTTAITRPASDGSSVVGTGPFRLATRDSSRLVLERCRTHWRSISPPLDQIDFRLLNPTAIAAGLRSGEVDLARDLLPQDLEEVLRDPRFRSGLVEAPKKNTYFVLFNSTVPYGRSEDLRRALTGVLKVHELVWRTLGRLAQPASGLIPPSIFGHDPGKKRSHLGREDALELLRRFQGGGGGEPIRLRASLHPLFQDRYRELTTAILQTWQDLGVEVTIATPTMESYLDTFRNNGQIDLILGRWNSDYDDPDNFTNGLFRSGNGVFGAYLSSAEMDALFDEARAETQPAVREELYRKIEDAMIRGGDLLPLFHEIDYRIAGPKVRGIEFRSNRPYVNYTAVGKAEEAGMPAPAIRTGGGVIYVPMAEDVRQLDPTLVGTAGQYEVGTCIFETLTRSAEGARIIPWLASDIHTEDGGKRYRFRLREDVRFHDGRRFTARDVRYSLERQLLNPASTNRRLLSPIRGAEALISGTARDLDGIRIVSNHELVMELDRPLSFFPALLSHPSAAVLQEGTERIEGTWRDHCVGTGAFRVVHFEPGRRLELERNPYYWQRGHPQSEGLVFQFGISPEEIRSEFMAGRLSLAADLFPEDVERLRHDPVLAAGYREIPRLSIYFAALNCHTGVLADPELRRSITRGVDVAGVIRRSIGRLAIPAHGIIPPGLLGYNQQRASVPREATAERRRGDLELTAAVHPIMIGQYSALSREMTALFRERGVQLRVMNKTLAEYLDLCAESSIDVIIGRWVGDYPDADTFVHGMLQSESGFIGRHCGSPELDLLIERGRTETDPAVRHALYRQVEELISRDARLLPLFHEQVYRFARPEVEGLVVNFLPPEVEYGGLRVR